MDRGAFLLIIAAFAVWTYALLSMSEQARLHVRPHCAAFLNALLIGVLLAAGLRALGENGGASYAWAIDWHVEAAAIVALLDFMRRSWAIAMGPEHD